MKQYLTFILADKKPKTNVYHIISENSVPLPLSGVIPRYEVLGVIKWYGPWRRYIFEAYEGVVWSWGCLEQIQDFIKKLMEERRDKFTKGSKGAE